MHTSVSKPARLFIFLLLFAFLLIFLMVGAARTAILPMHLLDFENYMTGSRMIWHLENPYGEVEFFAPPWMAILIGPFLLLPLRAAGCC
jgi:hypothetical protein